MERKEYYVLETAIQMKTNFRKLHDSGVALSPAKMNMLRLAPNMLLQAGLTAAFRSRFGHLFMYKHSMNAPEEMRQLHTEFYEIMLCKP